MTTSRFRRVPRALAALTLRYPLGVPPDRVTDLERPFEDTPIDLADIRPGDFVVVELSGASKDPAVRAVMVTFGSTSAPQGEGK